MFIDVWNWGFLVFDFEAFHSKIEDFLVFDFETLKFDFSFNFKLIFEEFSHMDSIIYAKLDFEVYFQITKL